MVLKRSVKRKSRKRNRRSLQKGAGYSFKLDCNLPGGVPEVVTYKNCGTPQADLAPPADSQLAPPGQAQAEVLGVSNDNLAPVEQQAQAPQQAQQAVQQAPQPAQQTGGIRRRSKKSRKSLKNRRRRINLLRGGFEEVGTFDLPTAQLQAWVNKIKGMTREQLSYERSDLAMEDDEGPLIHWQKALTHWNEMSKKLNKLKKSGGIDDERASLIDIIVSSNLTAIRDSFNEQLEGMGYDIEDDGLGGDPAPVLIEGGRRRRRSRRRRRRSNRKSRKSLRRRRRKTSTRRRRRRRRQSGGDLNCPNCNMATRTFGCKQPLWDAKCI